MGILSAEMYKAFYNRWFAVALSAGIVLGIISAMGTIVLYLETEKQMVEWWGLTNPLLSASSCFRFFMISDYTQPATDLFYALLPLIAVMPYGWSLCQEKKAGYLRNVFVRVSRVRYLSNKVVAACVSGGLAVILPLILNAILCACFIPAYTPDVSTVFNTGIYEFVMGSELYYKNPILFVFLYLSVSFLFSAFWAGFVVLLGGFTGSSARLMAGSFLLLYLLGSFEAQIGILLFGSGIEYLSVSPLVWLRGVAISGYTDIRATTVWLLILIVSVAILLLHWREKDVL